jgi:hypothetical protein
MVEVNRVDPQATQEKESKKKGTEKENEEVNQGKTDKTEKPVKKDKKEKKDKKNKTDQNGKAKPTEMQTTNGKEPDKSVDANLNSDSAKSQVSLPPRQFDFRARKKLWSQTLRMRPQR